MTWPYKSSARVRPEPPPIPFVCLHCRALAIYPPDSWLVNPHEFWGFGFRWRVAICWECHAKGLTT